MKNAISKQLFVCSLLVALIVALCVPFATSQTAVANAESDVYSMLNDEVITLYEREIAGESVVTNLTNKTISSLAEKNGFTVKKVQALILLSDLSARVGDKKTFVELAKLPDLSLLVFGKKCVDKYAKTLPKERQEELKEMFLSAVKEKPTRDK
ncbi:MAG: hypothetical protein IJ226_02325 [Clostridia bacterium]|nr:hypothetical protein [Clostridia bacterium]